MSMFKKLFRKKPSPFGAGIEADCRYCRYNLGEENPICSQSDNHSGPCKKYEYDPLRREPKAMPPLKEYKKEDFEL